MASLRFLPRRFVGAGRRGAGGKLEFMSPMRTDTFDLGALRLTAGEGRRLDLQVAIDPFSLGGETYPVDPEVVPARLDISRTTADGYALRLRFEAALAGPCMRCLQAANPSFTIDVREASQPPDPRVQGAGHGRAKHQDENDELSSPYIEHGVLDLHAWARDALALSVPANLLCREDCAGLCPVCGVNLNEAGREHRHEKAPDPRWAALSELRLE